MKKTKKTARDWTPVRRGDIYCAPACGGKCTIDAYLEAQKRGAALAKSLGPDWRPTIHENLGWHYGAESACGRFYVKEHFWKRGKRTDVSYCCFLGEPFSHSGKWTGDGKTARGAVEAAVEAARDTFNGYADLLKGIA